MTDAVRGSGHSPTRARILLALATLVGVLGMHGFSSEHALAGPTMTAITASAQTTANPANHAMTHEDVVAIPTGRVAPTAVVGQSECPMSHVDCLATLRSIPHEKYPIGAGLPFPTSPASSHLATAPTLTLIAGRSPPNLSLTRLCISRT